MQVKKKNILVRREHAFITGRSQSLRKVQGNFVFVAEYYQQERIITWFLLRKTCVWAANAETNIKSEHRGTQALLDY